MEIKDVMKALTNKGVSTSMRFNTEKQQFYVDLETRAKSELHLYEDGILRGRYEYEKKIDLTQDIEELIIELCHEFNNSLHGRGYYQDVWGDLCSENNIPLLIYYY